MIFDSETSSSDIKINDKDHKIKTAKVKALYLGIMCFATNCLSSIALEAGSRNSFRSISPRPAVFNNLFRRSYNLRIKIMIGDVLAALVSTTMLTIGDMYGIPYLYLPWLVNTIEGMVLHEGPAFFELAYTMLPNANLPTGLFMFITLLLYLEELCIWKDVFMNFERCWTKYNNNKNNKLKEDTTSTNMTNELKEDTTSTSITNKELCNEIKENLDENILSQKTLADQQDSTTHLNEFNNHGITELSKTMESNVSIKNRRSKSPFTEMTG